MQAITTSIIPATNTRALRLKASCSRGKLFIRDPEQGNVIERHREAARQLIARFVKEDLKQYGSPPESNPWNRPFLTGQQHNGDCVHVWPHLGSNALIVECADNQDLESVTKFIDLARKSDGTVDGLWAGLACSALKRSKETAI